MRERIVKARHDHTCTMCQGTIWKGDQYRLVETFAGTILIDRYCDRCW